jgi:hypothetical protein
MGDAVGWLKQRMRLRRAARALLAALGALLLSLAVLTGLLGWKAGALVHAGAVAEASRFGARIGRAVTVGPARVSLGRTIAVEIRDVHIAAAPGQSGPAAEPLFEVAAVRVRVGAWSIVRSLGKDVAVEAIEADGPVLRLVRLEGGALSYADVVEKLAAPEPRQPVQKAHVGRVAVRGARVELHDVPRGARFAVEKIDAVVPEIRPDAPVDLALDAAVLAAAPNLHLDLRLAPPGGPERVTGRLERAVLRLAPLDVEPLLPFVPVRGGIGVAGARLSADLVLAVDPQGVIGFVGTVEAGALRLSRGGEEALPQAVDAAVRADLRVDPEAPAVEARSFALTVAGMSVEGRADVRGPIDAVEVRALDLRARQVTFERLLPLLPPGLLPRGMALAGPIEARASARGAPREAELEVAVDLREASVKLPDWVKPVGVPLGAELRGKVGDGLAVEALGVRLGPLAIALRGKIRSATEVDLTFDSGDVGIDSILRLFPAIARGVPAGVTLAGHVHAAGHVRRSGVETRAEAKVALRRAGVRTEALTLEGAAELGATARFAPGSMALTVDLDAGGVRAQIPGKLDKAAGAPLAVHARVERAGAVTSVKDAQITLSGATLGGSARFDAAAHGLVVEAPSCALELGTLARTVPPLADVPPPLRGASVRAGLSYEGDTRDPGAGHLHLEGLDVAAPLGRLRGSVDVRGLAPLGAVTFDLHGESLHLDALAGGAGGGRGALGRVVAHGRLHLARLSAAKLDARDVEAELSLEKGSLAISTLRFAAYGGRLSAGGSRVDLSGAAPAFAVRARAERLDLAALAAGGDVSGKLDADVDLAGAGADWAAVAPTLSGTVKLALDGAHVHGKHTLRGTIINPLLHKLAERARQKHPVREVDTNIARADVLFAVGAGRVRTASPLVAHADEGTLTFEGSVGFDRTLAISGSVVIPPAAIEKLSKGWLVPESDATVKLRIDGTTEKPRIELLDLAGAARSLRGSFWNGVGKKIDHALGNE